MAEISIFKLADKARAFATRTKGQEMFEHLSAIIENSKGDRIIVDWSGVSAASPSFIDEFMGRICEVTQATPLREAIVITGDDEHVIDLVDTILKRRACPLRYALKPEDAQTGDLHVIGDPKRPRPIPA